MAPTEEGVRRMLVVAVCVLVVALVAVGAAIVLVDRGDPAGAMATRLESASSPGDDPFTSSVTIGPAVRFPGEVRAVGASFRTDLDPDAATGTLGAQGTAPGLYGGSGARQVCDPGQLASYLGDSPAKAAAWGAVLGVAPDQIGPFIATLTPLVLMSDTVVTNHGYRDGEPTAVPAVLQAGTAVLVNPAGVPTVKCNCGNPLTAPQPTLLTDAELDGDPWPTFTPAQVVHVSPAAPVAEFTVTDVVTGEPTRVPTGSTAPNPAPTSTSTSVPAATTSTAPPSTTAPTTTTTGEESDDALLSIDWKNHRYDVNCMGHGPPVDLEGGSQSFTYDGMPDGGVELQTVAYGDVDGDGRVEAAVSLLCFSGGSAHAGLIVVYSGSSSGQEQLGPVIESESEPEVRGGKIVTRDGVFGPNDPLCCPSSFETNYWAYSGGRWTSSHNP